MRSAEIRWNRGHLGRVEKIGHGEHIRTSSVRSIIDVEGDGVVLQEWVLADASRTNDNEASREWLAGKIDESISIAKKIDELIAIMFIQVVNGVEVRRIKGIEMVSVLESFCVKGNDWTTRREESG